MGKSKRNRAGKRSRMLCILSAVFLVSIFTGCQKKEYAVASKNAADSFPLKAEKEKENPQFAKSEGPYAIIHTSAGDITVILYPKQAPKAVENFIALAKEGYYNGSLFDYAAKEVFVQGGKPKKGEEKSNYDAPFPDELSDELHHFHGALAMANEGMDQNKSQFYLIASQEIPESEEIIAASIYMNEVVRAGNQMLNERNQVKKLTEEEVKTFEAELNKKVQAIGTDGVPKEVQERYQPAINKYRKQGGAYHLDQSHTVFGQVVEGLNIVDAMSKVLVDVQRKPKVDMMITSIEIVEEP